MKKILSSFVFCFALLSSTGLSAQELVSSEFLESISRAQMVADYGTIIQNGVHLYKITYSTPDIQGVPDTASGLVVIPDRENSVFPLLCYQHGTVGSRTDVPSNQQGGWELAAILGGMGYVTSAADYLGLGEARGFHPYVHAATEASAAIDMLFAVREFAQQNSTELNDQLFITGYSQGGHAAMAVHREIAQNFSGDFTVTAAAPMSGPYSISGEMKKVILSDQQYFFAAYIPFTILSYNQAYGLYGNLREYFKEPYATFIESFFNENIDLFVLNTILVTRLIQDFGLSLPKKMLQDSIIEAVTNQPDHPANLALADNDVFDWAPVAPTRLYYCQADDQVVYTNSIVADSVMNLNGAADLRAIDVKPGFNHSQCVEPALDSTILFFTPFQDIQTSTKEVNAGLKFAFYPNPAKEYLTVENVAENAELQIIDLSGRIHLTTQLKEQSQQISVAGLPAGLYILKIIADNGIWSEKVMVGR